ncbi:MAG TPA: type II toxin-antitoxin system VapC family toxin [Thermoanaerobaculia bacterium]|nr:type II toxin-antitoxin system VapC family toxin [Thermoanaerobaculia bacterium]
MAETLLYLDSSALVKLVLPERETAALRSILPRFAGLVSSALAEVEVYRAIWRVSSNPKTRQNAGQVLARVNLLDLDNPILSMASALEPKTLRSLDALHLASALSLGTDLQALVTYDARLAEAARQTGLEVLAPR